MYRVAFHWLETEATPVGEGVPVALTEALDPHRLVMRGTRHAPTRCVALAADIGRAARCSIYERRPSVCREVAASWEFGQPSPQCDRARSAHGLAPLMPVDWPAVARPGTAANDHGKDHDDDPSSPDRPPVAA